MKAGRDGASCAFCQIIRGQVPASRVYEDDLCVAFLDIHPVNPGHVLVISKRHVSRSFELSEVEAGHLFSTAQKIYSAIRKADLKCEGANFILSDGAVAGQEVIHAHLHIIPRFAGDRQSVGFRHAAPGAIPRSVLDSVAGAIREFLGD